MNLEDELSKLKAFQDTFLTNKDETYERLNYRPGHDFDELHLLERQIAFREGFASAWAKCEKQVIDYETDWIKMRKYYEGAKEKMAIAIEALEKLQSWTEDENFKFGNAMLKNLAIEALEKIKYPRSVQEKFNDIANGRD